MAVELEEGRFTTIRPAPKPLTLQDVDLSDSGEAATPNVRSGCCSTTRGATSSRNSKFPASGPLPSWFVMTRPIVSRADARPPPDAACTPYFASYVQSAWEGR